MNLSSPTTKERKIYQGELSSFLRNRYILNNTAEFSADNSTDTSTTPATPAAATPNIPKTKTNISIPLTEILGPYPYPAPTGMKWVPNGWRLERSVTTFQEVFLNKVKPVGEKAPKKRAKIDFKAKVRKHINDSDFLEFQRDDGLF